MMRSFGFFAAFIALGGAAVAAPPPAQWSYSAPGGQATATYPGNVTIGGACTGCGNPGGSDLSLQYNSGGVFAGTTSIVTNGTDLFFAGSTLDLQTGSKLAVQQPLVINGQPQLYGSSWSDTASILHTNGSAVIDVSVGADAGTASPSLTMPQAANGWSCTANVNADGTAAVMTEVGYSDSQVNFEVLNPTTWESETLPALSEVLINCSAF